MTHEENADDGYGASRRGFIAGTASLGGAGLVAGCLGGSGGSESGDGTAAQTAENDGPFTAEATVTHWPLLLYAPPYAVASEQGFFEEEGIDIEKFVGSSGGGTTVRNVVTGGLPFGEVSTTAAVKGYYAGAPLSIIAGSTNSPGTINWVTRSDSDISSITDLAGKTVGYTSAGSVTQNTSAFSVRNADGISVDDVEFRAMGGLSEGFTALEEGDIAAAANLDPVYSKQQSGSEKWDTVFWAKDHMDTFQQTVVIAGPDILENQPDVVRSYLRARRRGVEFVRENPAEAAEIYASFNDGYSADVMQRAIKNVEPERYYTTNEFSPEGLAKLEEGMKNIDLIDREIEWEKIVDQSFLPESKRIDIDSV